MIKTHNITNLKYLCKFSTEIKSKCFKYKGSGIYWKRHLKKHRPNITTEIIEECNTIEQLKERGLYWSNFYNIVNSEEWANLKPEDGNCVSDYDYYKIKNKRNKTLEEYRQSDEYKNIRKQCGLQTKIRQLGKTMRDRLGYDYLDPRKNKKWVDIYKSGYKHPQIKPFKLILNEGQCEWVFNCESEVLPEIGIYPYPLLGITKAGGIYTIKNISHRSKHQFKKGDKLSLQFI